LADDADTWARRTVGGIGVLAAAAGVTIVSPGLKDALLAILNKTFGLGLYLDAPPWMGWLLIAVGFVLLILAYFGQGRVAGGLSRIFDGRDATIGTLVAVKHAGFLPVVRDIRTAELPQDLARRDLRHLNVDLSLELSASPPALETALAKQLRMPDQIAAFLGVNPQSDLAYCGIVQAPFQLLAGHQLASWTRVRSFEWHRHDQRWVPLDAGAGIDLGVSTVSATVGGGEHVAICVEVSYAIAEADILASVPNVGVITRVAVAAPALDCIKHEGQAAEIARQFRAALDGARHLAAGAQVHVFCAAPMSVGFALGRMVSRTLHPPVRSYAYDRSAGKPYPWGLEINSPPGPGRVVRN
jgi:hypothetical protein